MTIVWTFGNIISKNDKVYSCLTIFSVLTFVWYIMLFYVIGCHGRDPMIVGFTCTITCAVSSYHH